jgi:hypothetical protein
VALVIKFHEGRGVRVLLLQVQIVYLWLLGRVPAILANIHLASPLFIFIVMGHPMHLETVALQGTALGK